MPTFLKRLFAGICIFLLVFTAFAMITGKTYLFKAALYNFANINDYEIFDNSQVETGVPKPWPVSTSINKIGYPDSLNNLLSDLKSVGLLMIKNDSMVFEKYWAGYSDTSHSGSFSVAKSITSLLIGCAIKEGKIKSIHEPVSNYIPEFKAGDKAAVKLIDLLTMSSGTDFSESYWNPLSVTSELYYGTDVYKTATGVKMINKPGTVHKYKSGDTQLLGLIVEKATGKTLAEYAAEKLWKPLGAEHPALWSNDKKGGHAKAYCCFNSNVRDFARIGKFMLDSGKINGVAVIDSAYFKQSITACNIKDEKGNACNYYGYQWWIDPENPEIFYARGILGQYIINIPSKKMIIVRLGKITSPIRVNTVPKEVRYLINWGLKS